MRAMRAGIVAGVSLALTIVAATLPLSLDPDRVAKRLNASIASYGYRFDRPTSATLRLFPEPLLDVFGVRLTNASGKPVFSASTVAIKLSWPSLFGGRYAPVRARLKDPAGDIDLDALAGMLPQLSQAPPVASLQVRGGRLHLHSARLEIDETLSPVNGSYTWNGANRPFQLALSGSWRGHWTTTELGVHSPKDFVFGHPSQVRFDLTVAGAKASLEGNATLGDKSEFSGTITAEARSLADVADWFGLDALGLPDAEGGFTGKASLSPAMLSFDEGRLSFKGQGLDGGIGLQHGPSGWMATATLAADTLDLGPLLGPPPRLTTLDGGWSRAPIVSPLPAADLDMRFSATNATWGGANFSNAAVAITRRNDETRLKILEAGFAGGNVSGEIVVRDCAQRCATQANLAFANIDAARLTGVSGAKVLNGVGSVELDLKTSGDTPSAMIAAADGDVNFTLRDGALVGVNFEEALRRSQRRPIDISRDLLVGQTAFQKLDSKVSFSRGVARSTDAHLSGPGVDVLGQGEIDLVGRKLQATLLAKQADGLGHASPGGAALDFDIRGPWPALNFSAQTLSN